MPDSNTKTILDLVASMERAKASGSTDTERQTIDEKLKLAKVLLDKIDSIIKNPEPQLTSREIIGILAINLGATIHIAAKHDEKLLFATAMEFSSFVLTVALNGDKL